MGGEGGGRLTIGAKRGHLRAFPRVFCPESTRFFLTPSVISLIVEKECKGFVWSTVCVFPNFLLFFLLVLILLMIYKMVLTHFVLILVLLMLLLLLLHNVMVFLHLLLMHLDLILLLIMI